MDKLCRLCLHFESNMIAIFYEDTGKTSELQSQIQHFCSVEVSVQDPLPKMICNDCKEKLSSIEEFRKQCKQSDFKLRQHYQISTCTTTQETLSKVLQDVGIQTEGNIENSFDSKHSCTTVKEQNLWEDVTPVSLERIQDQEHYEKSDSVMNGLCSTNNYESDECMVEKKNVNPRRRLRSQAGTDITLGKEKTKCIKNKKNLTCHMCGKVYVSKKALLNHTEAHMNEKIGMCKVCNRVFNNSKKFTEHMKKHNVGMELKCEVCGMPFKEQAKLNFHLRVHGKGPPINTDKQYLCDMCSRTFASKSGLRFHLKAHAGTKPYSCKFCNKSFTIPSYRKRHERTHTGDKHFICHICSAGFASANGLKYHLRSHTGEANYHCNTCGKSFRRLKYLKEHTFIHTGERPFICKICGSAYGNSGSLFVHEKKCKAQYALGIIAASKIQDNDQGDHT